MKMNLFPRLMFAFLLFVIIFITIVVVSYIVNEKMIAQWIQKPEPPGRVYSLKSGSLYATLKGHGTTTIVILPGLGTTSAEWWAIQDTLSKDFQVLTYDRPGYTWSTPNADNNYATQEQLLIELIADATTHTDTSNIVLVGHNIGANIAHKFFEKHTLKAAIFIDPLLDASTDTSGIDAKWRNTFIDQTESLSRFKTASQLGFFRFLNLTPYDVPESIRQIVINNIANPETAKAVLNEYNKIMRETPSCLNTNTQTRTIVITHNAEKNIELMKSFGAPEEVAKSIEGLFQKNALSYNCSKNSKVVSALKSVFDIHISEPDLIIQNIKSAAQ